MGRAVRRAPLHPAVVVPENSSFVGAFGLLDGQLAAPADGGNTVRIWDLEDRTRRLI